MRIHSVRLENFRAIKNCEMPMDPHTVIIGSNNAGKSTFLKALDLFFDSAPKVARDDFHQHQVKSPISISVMFGELTPEERDLFSSNLIKDKLQITRELIFENPKESGTFFVHALANPDFTEVRNDQSKTSKKAKYNALREQERYRSLPTVSSADDIDGHFEAWERDNESELKLIKLATFRGFKNVAVGQLKKKTEFVLVPAVRDAAQDAGAAKGAPAKQLVDTIARQTIENREDYKAFISNANAEIRRLTDPNQVEALGEISQALSDSLKRFYTDAELIASWEPLEQIPISLPSSKIDVKNAGHTSPVEFVGHGLQRAIIITILDFLSRQKSGSASGEFEEAQSDLIIGIEEPEIYQHPTKQRHIARVLASLAEAYNKETGIRLQIISVTHSPLFVNLPRFSEVRIMRRHQQSPELVLSQLTLSECSKDFADLKGATSPLRDDAFAAKLHIFDADISEGFFATKVVLVEGVSDRAILEAAYKQRRRSPIEEGIAIISCEGKKKLHLPAYIFHRLGIPTFVLLDNDQTKYVKKTQKEIDSEIQYNRLIQKICGVSDSEITDWPCVCEARFSAWDGNLEEYLKGCAAEKYESARAKVMRYFDVSGDDCVKSPTVASALLTHLLADKVLFTKLDQVIDGIDAL